MDNNLTLAPPPNKLKLTAYVFKYPKQFCIQAAGGIVYNTVVVFGAVFLGKTIDAANLVYKAEAPLSLFYLNLCLFIGFTVIFQMARYFKRYYMRAIVNLLKCDIRAGLLSSFFEMPLAGLSKEKVGDMMSRMIGDVEQVGDSVKSTVTEMWDTALLMLSYFTACCFYSPKITLLAAIPIPAAIVTAQLLRKPLYSLSQKSRKAASKINIHLQHNVSGIGLLRLFGLEESDRSTFSKLLDEQLKWNVAAAALQNGMLPLYILIATSGLILVVGLGGAYVVNGQWTIGTFTAFLSMFTAMAVRTNIAAKVMNTWHGAKASWDRICEKLAAEIEAEAEPATVRQAPESDTALEVRSLSFTFPFSEEPCLQDISFTVKKGEIVGITGAVGSGKSALAAALSGLFPYEGEVWVDGMPLHALHDLRNKKIAYMDAEHFVFSDDAAYNITLGDYTGALDEALTLTALDYDIANFENGIHTRLMERGVRVSGGQRQRIALARAWYSRAEILILDDPFSAVDIHMEREIMAHIKQSLNGRTVLLFSHRLAAFTTTDHIIIMDKGKIIQTGTHNTLMQEPDQYRDIFTAQAFMRNGGAHENE